MQLAQPTISIIVPVYNGDRFLAEALNSILQQEYHPLEVLVIDDGSTDRSAAVASTFPAVRLLRKPHSGVAPTLNLGLRHATGELLGFLDADDRWLPGKLARQVAELTQRPELDIVFGQTRQFTVRQTGYGDEVIYYAAQAAPHKSSMLIRRTAFMRAGEFAEQQDCHDFLDWYARAMDRGLQAVMVDQVTNERRIHDQNLGRIAAGAQRSQYLSTLRAIVTLRRQPAQGGADQNRTALPQPLGETQ